MIFGEKRMKFILQSQSERGEYIFHFILKLVGIFPLDENLDWLKSKAMLSHKDMRTHSFSGNILHVNAQGF